MARYHLYISNAKLDVLLGSMPERTRKKLAIELKVDLKVVSASLSHELSVGPREHRVARLDAVVQHLRETDHVGTLASPGSYIEDTLDMAYATYPAEPAPLSDSRKGGAATVFAGVLGDQCLIMVGSSSHLTGKVNSLRTGGDDFSSDLPTIVRLLDGLSTLRGSSRDLNEPAARRCARDGYVCAREVLREIPTARLEFMAKTLFRSTLDSRDPDSPSGMHARQQVIVASPLYVALGS